MAHQQCSELCTHSGRMCNTRWHSLARTLLESNRSWDVCQNKNTWVNNALNPLHTGTVCLSEGKMSSPNNFSGGILTNVQVRSIMQASECKRSLHFEPLITCPSGETSNRWTLSICTVLSYRLAQQHRFNWAFPLCLVYIDLQFRCIIQLTSLKKDQCCGLGYPLTVKKSVFIHVIIVTCDLYKHTHENVLCQYYPKYIALGNDRICNASVHCLYIIIGAILPHSTEHGGDTPHVECILKIIRRAVRPLGVTNCNA